jgi:hypothetical protein
VKLIRIYRGLISGYTAKLAAFARKERLDTMSGTDEYYKQFWVWWGIISNRDIPPVR